MHLRSVSLLALSVFLISPIAKAADPAIPDPLAEPAPVDNEVACRITVVVQNPPPALLVRNPTASISIQLNGVGFSVYSDGGSFNRDAGNATATRVFTFNLPPGRYLVNFVASSGASILPDMAVDEA